MTTLYIIRHAWAGDHDARRFPDDSLRPLTDEGRRRFRRLVKKVIKRGFAPALIATSPLVRCRQTAQIVADVLDSVRSEERSGALMPIDRPELAPGSDLAGIVAWTAAHAPAGSGDIAWVGHAPDVGDLTAALIGGQAAAIDFSKGAIAAIAFEGPIAISPGTLQWLATAKLLNV